MLERLGFPHISLKVTSRFLRGVQMSDGFYPYQRWKLRPGALPKHFLLRSKHFYSNILVMYQY